MLSILSSSSFSREPLPSELGVQKSHSAINGAQSLPKNALPKQRQCGGEPDVVITYRQFDRFREELNHRYMYALSAWAEVTSRKPSASKPLIAEQLADEERTHNKVEQISGGVSRAIDLVRSVVEMYESSPGSTVSVDSTDECFAIVTILAEPRAILEHWLAYLESEEACSLPGAAEFRTEAKDLLKRLNSLAMDPVERVAHEQLVLEKIQQESTLFCPEFLRTPVSNVKRVCVELTSFIASLFAAELITFTTFTLFMQYASRIPEFWSKHRSTKKGCQRQIEELEREFGILLDLALADVEDRLKQQGAYIPKSEAHNLIKR